MDVGALVNQQYKVIEHIGRGGMADVWSARDTRLRRMVAIKTIVAGLGKDVDPVELFKREAHTIAQLEHPHILPIYDFGEYDNNLYIIMRYVTGGSLEEMLRDGPMPLDDVLRMGQAIGQALDYAHENNVIHLDLKPPNILLDSSGSPYLADFGLATVLDPEGRARNPGSGTLLYMAPEQMIAETIDHRADIFSFCIMLYHMLMGKLPFDGNTPLGMALMTSNDELPYINDLPSELTDLLRLGTHQDPKYRPETHTGIMEQFHDIVKPSGVTIMPDFADDDDYVIEQDPYNLLTEADTGGIADEGLLEAVDIYSRARYDWQGGQGRFLLGVTHFILMSEYYQDAAKYNLGIDEAGYQMLLRGAIEYDYELAYWWRKVDDDDRRWVCLHALRSGNTPARIRSLYRLETLPDEEGTAAIPRLVAQALEVETDDAAKIAALKVLGTRARLMKKETSVNIKTEYRGRLISSMTRLGIEVNPPAAWQETIYSADVDVLVAEQSFDESPEVAEFAARTVGRMRSLAAVSHLAKEQQIGRSGALQALAFVRDEAPSLPEVVDREARFYAWITNTVRRLTENPIQTVVRLSIMFLAGWIAMGNHIWGYFRIVVGSLANQRWSNSLGLGISFGFLMAVTYFVTVEISNRLRGFWPWWMRLLLSGILGYGMATLSFASFRYLFIQEPVPSILWDEMRFVGAAFAFGLVATSLLQLRGWQGVLLTTVATFTPIVATFTAFYFPQESTILPLAPVGLLLGLFCGWRAAQMTNFESDNQWLNRPYLPQIVGAILGLTWLLLVWLQFVNVARNLASPTPVTWDTALNITTINVVVGVLAGYWLNNLSRWSFVLTSLVGFLSIYAMVAWHFFDYSFAVPFASPAFEVLYYEGTPLIPQTLQPIFNYDLEDLNHLYRLTLPTIIVVALGANMPELLSGWYSWIGSPRTPKERGAWLGTTLGYVMLVTALVSVLTLFSPGINRLWELAWSGWAFVTFVFALATFRWTKWGANGLLWSGILLLVGGILFDGVAMYLQATEGTIPALFTSMPQVSQQLQQMGIPIAITQAHFWGGWAVLLAIFVWGALRRLLWGGIGLVFMLIAWYAIFIGTPLYASVAIFAATNVALLAYVLQPKYHLMEIGRLRHIPFFARTQQPTSEQVLETLLNPTEMPLQPASPTQIFTAESLMPETDPMQTQSPSQDTLGQVDTEPKTTDEMDTVAPAQTNTEELHTQFPRSVEINDEDLVFDTNEPSLNTVLDAQQNKSELSDIKITLDTSALKSDTEPRPKDEGSELTDLKINLDTSGLKSPPDSGDTEEKSAPKPIFRFDASNVVNQNTVQFEKDEPSDEPSENEDDDTEEENS